MCGPCYLNDDCSLLIHCDYSVVMSSSEHLQRRTVTSLKRGDIEPVTQHTFWRFHYNFLISAPEQPIGSVGLDFLQEVLR